MGMTLDVFELAILPSAMSLVMSFFMFTRDVGTSVPTFDKALISHHDMLWFYQPFAVDQPFAGQILIVRLVQDKISQNDNN